MCRHHPRRARRELAPDGAYLWTDTPVVGVVLKESAKIRFPVQSRVVLPLPLMASSKTLAKADTGRKAGPETAAADAPIPDVAYSTET